VTNELSAPVPAQPPTPPWLTLPGHRGWLDDPGGGAHGRIIVAGEALIDLVAEDRAGGYRAVPGGSPANVAVTLARLDQPVSLLARISSDAFGRRLRAHLDGNGVDLGLSVAAAEPTSLAVASLDDDNRADYDFYLTGTADWQWRPQELPAALDSRAVALHSGSLALALAPGACVLEALLRREYERDALTLSVDLNLRPSILVDRAAQQERIERQIRFAHLVKASDEDLAWLYPGRSVQDVAAAWHAAGVACAVVTLGAQGAYLLAPDGSAFQQTARPVNVVDTVGAGDSFTGGLLAALARLGALGERPGDRLAALTPRQWLDVLDHAGTVAGLTCGRRGADPPTLAEVIDGVG
jgi:fructokinase